MKEAYRGIERAIFSESYILFCKYVNAGGSDEAYLSMQSDFRQFVQKYRNTDGYIIAKDISIAVLNQLDRINKNKEGDIRQ